LSAIYFNLKMLRPFDALLISVHSKPVQAAYNEKPVRALFAKARFSLFISCWPPDPILGIDRNG
jgi:hypothetical protein